jgi:ATP-dependent DNA helicase 2 subunit 2
MAESNVIYAQKYNYKAQVAFSSLVQGLHKAEAFAVARLVPKDRAQPILVLLAPDIENSCLYDIPLPFAEDVRQYQFPPLDRVVTITGTTLTQHRLLPGDDLNEAMSDYVDAMDLSGYQVDDDGNPVEYMALDEPFNPVIHRIKHVVKARAINPDKPLPEIPEVLKKFSTPPSDLVEQAQAQIDALISAAEVKKGQFGSITLSCGPSPLFILSQLTLLPPSYTVPPKAKGKFRKEKAKPLSGLDLDAILGPPPKTATISPQNAVPEFKRVLERAAEVSPPDATLIRDASRQMGDIIKDLIRTSFGGGKDDRALEHLGVMRDELRDVDLPEVYNSFVRDLKIRMLAGELDGDRRELWWKVRSAKLGLIDEGQSGESKVTVDEAWEVSPPPPLFTLLLFDFGFFLSPHFVCGIGDDIDANSTGWQFYKTR